MDEKFNEKNGESWDRYKIYVIETIRRLRLEMDDLKKKMDDDVMTKLNEIENEISKLQIKSGVWGLLAGLLSVLAAILIKSFFAEK